MSTASYVGADLIAFSVTSIPKSNVLCACVMECGADTASLHVKVAIYHHKRAEERPAMQLQLSDMKVILMPRLRLLTVTQLDQDGLY
jgi:hypothetical protein